MAIPQRHYSHAVRRVRHGSIVEINKIKIDLMKLMKLKMYKLPDGCVFLFFEI